MTAERNRFEFMRGKSDCVRASFASVLSLPYEDLPDIDSSNWVPEIIKFLEPMNLTILNVKLDASTPALPGLHVASIGSTRGNGYEHCVVVRDGEIIFDPEQIATNGRPLGKTEIIDYTPIVPLDAGKLIAELRKAQSSTGGAVPLNASAL